MLRAIIALLLTPLVAAITIWLLIFVVYGEPDNSTFRAVWFFGYFIAIFLGVPAIFIYKMLALFQWWQYGLFGAVCSMVPVFLILVPASENFPTLSWFGGVIVESWMLPVSGGVAAVFFWFICGRQPNQSAKTPASRAETH